MQCQVLDRLHPGPEEDISGTVGDIWIRLVVICSFLFWSPWDGYGRHYHLGMWRSFLVAQWSCIVTAVAQVQSGCVVSACLGRGQKKESQFKSSIYIVGKHVPSTGWQWKLQWNFSTYWLSWVWLYSTLWIAWLPTMRALKCQWPTSSALRYRVTVAGLLCVSGLEDNGHYLV